MQILILSLLVLAVVAALLGWLRLRWLKARLRRGEIDALPTVQRARPDGCCGKHAVCEKEALLQAAARPEVEYFEDEELDRFARRPADSYTPEEVEEFEEVLTTMRPDEIPAWLSSLQLREVALPAALKDEVILLLEQ